MKIQGKFRVISISKGDDVNFVQMSDIDEGGLFKMIIPSEVVVKNDELINLDCVAKPSQGKSGLNIRFLKNSNTKGD